MGTHDPDFSPHHGTSPNCLYHKQLNKILRCKPMGSFGRQAAPGCKPRFLCGRGKRSFSTRVFSTADGLKRPDILLQLSPKTIRCMPNRKITRDLQMAPSTIGLVFLNCWSGGSLSAVVRCRRGGTSTTGSRS
jgi:hypothetical protein